MALSLCWRWRAYVTRFLFEVMRMALTWLNALSLLAFLCLLLFRGSENNHISYDPRAILVVPIVTFISEAILWGRSERKFSKLLRLGITCMLALVVMFADEWNFLVQYDRWLDRGMPRAGEFRISSEMRDALNHHPAP